MCLLLKVLFFGFKYIIHIGLWINIYIREHGTLYLYLKFMSLFKGMEDILKFYIDLGFLIGHKGFWLGKVISKPSPKHFTTYHLMIVPHF